MARKRFTTEQIIGMLREAEVRPAQGQAIGLIRKSLGPVDGLPPDEGKRIPKSVFA